MKNIKYEITEIRTTPLVLEIPQMSDERWQELARKNAVRNYTRENGREPESVAQAVAAGESEDGIISFRGMLRQQRIRTIESREKVSGAGVCWLPFLFTKDYFLRHIVAYNGFFAYREPTETIWIIYYRLLNLVEIIDYILLLVQWYKFSTDLY